MLNKILSVLILGIFVGLGSADAQPGAPAPIKVKGKIIAARVEGHVDAISKADGKSRVLHDRDALTDGMRIVTAPGASVILVFSNGASVDVGGDSTLDIDEFMQDPFAADEKVAEMTEEPGTSTTKLNLARGELVGKVVHLNVDRGSEFSVQTPVGAAGIRGTTFRIVFRPGSDGAASFSVMTADGRVVFKGSSSGPLDVPIGRKIVAIFDVNSGVATQPIVLRDITPQEAAEIQALAQKIIEALLGTSFLNGLDNTPSLPAVQPLQTTSQTGSTG
jgi:hypothetical protein